MLDEKEYCYWTPSQSFNKFMKHGNLDIHNFCYNRCFTKCFESIEWHDQHLVINKFFQSHEIFSQKQNNFFQSIFNFSTEKKIIKYTWCVININHLHCHIYSWKFWNIMFFLNFIKVSVSLAPLSLLSFLSQWQLTHLRGLLLFMLVIIFGLFDLQTCRGLYLLGLLDRHGPRTVSALSNRRSDDYAAHSELVLLFLGEVEFVTDQLEIGFCFDELISIDNQRSDVYPNWLRTLWMLSVWSCPKLCALLFAPSSSESSESLDVSVVSDSSALTSESDSSSCSAAVFGWSINCSFVLNSRR